jgi:hypothetical protein
MRTCLGIVVAMCLFLVGAVPAQAAPLTDDTLKAMLENLGYTVDVSGDKPPLRFKVPESAPDGSFDFTITVERSTDKDGRTLWIYTALFEIPKDKPVASSRLLALLAKSDEIGPMFFSYNDKNRLLYLNDPIPNRDITPASLRQTLKTLISTMVSTHDLWDVPNWK